MIDGLRRRVGTASAIRVGGSAARGLRSEFVEDCAEGRARESFFMFLDRGLVVGGKLKDSVSEVAEESAEAQVEVSGDARTMLCACWGVSMRRGASGPFLRDETAAGKAGCGRGVAASMF